MLLQFSFQNFKSFRDEAVLDMSATRISELTHHVITIGKEKILPIALIYGANASGKSNVIEAFSYMSRYVLYSFSYGGGEFNKRDSSIATKLKPFMLDKESSANESVFEVYFTDKVNEAESVYNYGFSILQNEVAEEWLNYKAKASSNSFKKVFYRHKDDGITFYDIPKQQQENIQIALEKETLIVSLGAMLKVKRLQEVRDWFHKNVIANFGNPRSTYFMSTMVPAGFTDNETVRQDVIKYLSAFDSSIVGFNLEVVEDETEDKPAKLKIDALHRMNDSDSLASLPLSAESDGTLKMFALYPLLHKVLKNGATLFIDEMNARLHPLLVRTIMILFLDREKNPNHAQLVFTTHDTWQLSNDMVRRDEIWLTEKGNDGASSLYSLVEFTDDNGVKIRKDENYEKNYLLGKYGAIPEMKSFGILKEGDTNEGT